MNRKNMMWYNMSKIIFSVILLTVTVKERERFKEEKLKNLDKYYHAWFHTNK